VVGASTLAYGLWGAQIAIGFRFGRLLPPELQSRYGVGNLVLFLPLAFASLFDGPGVSLVGHAGGLVGGIVAAVVCTPLGSALGRGIGIAALAATALVPFTPPTLWTGGWLPTAISDHASIALPARFAGHVGRWYGMHAWSSGDRYPVFAGTFVSSDAGPGGLGAQEAAAWGQWLQGAVTVTEEGQIVRLVVQNDEEPWHLVERVVERDGLRTRAGYLLPPACAEPGACAGRRSLGDAVLASLDVSQ
jgi:hypothetical protein